MLELLVGAGIALAGVWVGMLGRGWATHMELHYRLRRMSRATGASLYCSTCNRWFPSPPRDVVALYSKTKNSQDTSAS